MLPYLENFKNIVLYIEELKEEEKLGYTHLNLKIVFIDNSILFVNEVVTFYNTFLKYSYHWQSADNQMIVRWDNAPHHPTISTFPHHKHISSNENVQPSSETTLTQVLDFISKTLIT